MGESETAYRRPDISRPVIVNPAHRESNDATALESEVVRLHKQRIPQQRREYRLRWFEYEAPFNYDNVRVELGRPWENAPNFERDDCTEEEWGVIPPMNDAGQRPTNYGAEVNQDGVELDVPPFGSITFVEDLPIVEVTVIGSACCPPGYVLLFGEPVEWKYWRTGVKMYRDGLWGEHVRIGPWSKGLDEGYRDAGLNCARFSIPPCRKVMIMAGSQHLLDNKDWFMMRHDAHYCVRFIRVAVRQDVP